MKRLVYFSQLIFFVISPFLCFSQRPINLAPGAASTLPNSVPYNGSLYFLSGDLFEFNGTATIAHPLPSIGGAPLVAGTEAPSAFNARLYVSCSNASGKHVLSYDGSTFTDVPLGPIASNTVVFNGQLYVLTMSGTTMNVVAHNGTVNTIMRSLTVPAGTFNFQLVVSGNSLFVFYAEEDFLSHILRFDGATWTTIPDVSRFNAAKVVTMPGSSDVLFFFDDYVSYLYYYHGGVIDRIPSAPLDALSRYTGMFSWRGAFWIQENYEDEMTFIFSYRDGVFQGVVPIPDGAYAHYMAEPVVFNNELYFVTRTPAPDFGVDVYKYDGTTTTHFLTLPTRNSREPWLGVRDGKLIIIPDTWYFNNIALEYDGVSITTIEAPPGKVIRKYWGRADCFYGWIVGDPFSSSAAQYGAETRSCSPPVFPIAFGRLEEFDLSAYAQGRDWCWTGVGGGWINPNCLYPPFCQDPAQFQVSMIGLLGRVAYQNEFDKPFTANFGLPDKLPYTLTLGMKSGKSFDPVLALGPGLVARGFESFSMKVVPKDESFRLTVTTDKGKQIPFTLTLLNAKGKVVFTQTLTAPVDKFIKGKPTEPGVLLVVTAAITSSPTFQEYGIESIASYPNPTSGKIFVDIQRAENSDTKVSGVVHDLFGNKVWSGTFNDQGDQIDLTGKKPGLYILTFNVGGATERRVIQLK